MPELSTITDPFLPESKGVSAAAAGLSFVTDGAGSGSFKKTPYVTSSVMADVSTPSVVYVPTPSAGLVTKIVGILHGAITLADSTITAKNSAGVSMGTVVVPFTGSAAGLAFVINPVANNAVSADSFITIESNGNSTTVAIMTFSTLIVGA